VATPLTRALTRPHMHYQQLLALVELDLLDHRPLDSEQAAP
jgi:hypothetical protein